MSEFARTRYHAFRDRFGLAGVIISVIALVAALGGSALAAGGLTKSQERQVTKIAKKYAGKPGANGAPGPAGAAGPEGAAGTNGKNGKSVVLGTATSGPGEECQEGGVTVEVEGSSGSKRHVCNGQPWTAGGTLPKGKSESGTWTVPFLHAAGFPFTAGQGPFSFGIPLKATPTVAYVNSGGEESVYNPAPGIEEFGSFATAVNCTGNAATPKAKEGFLCIYEEFAASGAPAAVFAHASGAVLTMIQGVEGSAARGTWAVTSAE